MNIGNEILINASHITHGDKGASYEFILDMNLCVKESIRIDSINDGGVSYIKNPKEELVDMLFELNHVRVNPQLNNKEIIKNLTTKLKETGISITEQPSQNQMSLCFKPLGKINTNVRFNLGNKGQVIFMSPIKPKLFCAKNK